jgi:hypothetical protein
MLKTELFFLVLHGQYHWWGGELYSSVYVGEEGMLQVLGLFQVLVSYSQLLH